MTEASPADICWLIAGGCPRSGTTLLNLVLNSHPRIKISNEQNLGRTISIMEGVFDRERRVAERRPRAPTGSEVGLIPHDEIIREYTIKRKSSFLPALLRLYQTSISSDPRIHYFGDKYPRYYTWDLTQISTILPSLKILHISRNPLHTIGSSLERSRNTRLGLDWWAPRTLHFYINEWITAWNFIQSGPDRFPSISFCHVKYEDLCSHPAETLSRIADFLSVDDDFSTTDIVQRREAHHGLTKKQTAVVKSYIPHELIEWDTEVCSGRGLEVPTRLRRLLHLQSMGRGVVARCRRLARGLCTAGVAMFNCPRRLAFHAWVRASLPGSPSRGVTEGQQ